MELHSYAKTRSNRIWTIEHKRKLVDNRITLDVLFNKKAFNIIDSWRKLMKVSDFECFDLLFVRKQWANTLTKYKSLIMRHSKNDINADDNADNNADIDDETREFISNEWEFFDKIYRWVKYKERMHTNYNSIILEENETVTQMITSQNQIKNDNIVLAPTIITDQQSTYSNPPKNSSINYNNNNNNINNNDNTITHIINNQNNNGVVIRTVSSDIDNNFKIPTPPDQHSEQQFQLTVESELYPSVSNPSPADGVDDHHKTKLKYNKLKAIRKRNSKKKQHRKYANLKRSAINMEKKLNAFCQIFAQIVDRDYPEISTVNLLTDHNNSTEDDSNSSSD